ncbi:MAG: helix-turn-helix transcriptional regulator [Puniceicoccales bacterium]
MIISEVMDVSSQFPSALPEPVDYLQGVNAPMRPHARNALVFMRKDRTNLQQQHFQNRSHHRHVLMFVVETPGTVIVDGIGTRLEAGQGMFVLPFQFHHYIDLDAEKLRWLFITFELEEGSPALDNLGHRLIQPDSVTTSIWAKIASAWQGNSPIERSETLPLIDLLLMKLMQSGHHSNASRADWSARGSWIARAEALLRQAVEENWTLGEVAQRCGLSERHFRTRFEAECGVTIRQYRANFQLHRTLALMRGTQVSFSEIAERVGFQSSAAFSRFIRRETGMTPMELKRTL